jgi:multiple sugar transport system permease protein
LATTVERAGAERRLGPRPRARGATRSEGRLAFWLIVPAAIFMLGVVGYPIIRALILSLFSDNRFGTPEFIGFRNYARALWGSGASDFWPAFRVTTFFTVISVLLELAIGLTMALIMHKAFRGRGLVRTSVLVPWAIPTAVTAQLWLWMFQPTGIVNALLNKHLIWTGSQGPARAAVIVADTWKTAPFIALLLLAGLQIIPDELYEAAKVDGATAFERFRRITLPLLRNAMLVAVLFRMLDVLRIFDLPWILTNGANGTTTLSILSYQTAIQQVKFHYGSVLSTLTFVYILLAAFLFVKLLGANVVQSQAREVR